MRAPNPDALGIVEGSVHILPEAPWTTKRRDYENWVKAGQPLPESDDPKVGRAAEMVQLGYLPRAFSILRCASWACRDRFCPTCGVERLRDHRDLVRRVRKRMKRPVLVIFSVYSKALSAAALERAYQRLRSAMRATQRCRSFSTVKSGIGRIEAVPSDLGGRLKGRKVWHVHAHVIVDLGEGDELDVSAVRRDFNRCAKKTTGRDRSYFGLQEIRSVRALESYITKARDVCPAPGVRTLEELDQLITVFKGKELLVSWGVKDRGLRRSTRTKAPPTVTSDTWKEPTLVNDPWWDQFSEPVPRRRSERPSFRWVVRGAAEARPASKRARLPREDARSRSTTRRPARRSPLAWIVRPSQR